MDTEDKKEKYTPNDVPYRERVMNIIVSILLFGYGTYGIVKDDLYFPSRKFNSPGIHLHGAAVWVMYTALLCLVANMMLIVIDHYDKRNNEANYEQFCKISKIAGFTLFTLSILVACFDVDY